MRQLFLDKVYIYIYRERERERIYIYNLFSLSLSILYIYIYILFILYIKEISTGPGRMRSRADFFKFRAGTARPPGRVSSVIYSYNKVNGNVGNSAFMHCIVKFYSQKFRNLLYTYITGELVCFSTL